MNAARVTMELGTIQKRTRKLLIVSTILHAVFLLYVAWERVISPAEEHLTEIAWLEADEIESIIAEATAAYRVAAASVSEPVQQHFERTEAQGDVAPESQDLEAFEDKVNERLEALKQKTAHRSTAGLETKLPARRPSLAGVAGATPSSRPRDLVRTQTASPNPIELKRAAPKIQKAAVAVPLVPQPKPSARPEKAPKVVTRKVLAGVSMTGPVADRPLVSYRKPAYPDWAKREAIEGSVDIYFVVQPDGSVKTNVMIQKTSGFEDFDRNATDALLAWRFQPLQSGVTGEQWGTITFHYRLSNATGN